MSDKLLFVFIVGFLGGGGLSHAILTDNTEALERENRVLQAKVKPLDFECPAPMVKVAIKSDSGPWVRRCVMAGKVRAM